ncbi:hypothetical protein F511_03301 [Dorcoceras hygrometricum]|uniref:Uncharacterized protein n=1 Tax=Dorcoceras hygrometricum TaxID=472368 RepID=A0A2Z7BFY7_9LAMI|nr:hypothetical protein F511_03301 [Dorcoceras hygrometricum]
MTLSSRNTPDLSTSPRANTRSHSEFSGDFSNLGSNKILRETKGLSRRTLRSGRSTNRSQGIQHYGFSPAPLFPKFIDRKPPRFGRNLSPKFAHDFFASDDFQAKIQAAPSTIRNGEGTVVVAVMCSTILRRRFGRRRGVEAAAADFEGFG